MRELIKITSKSGSHRIVSQWDGFRRQGLIYHFKEPGLGAHHEIKSIGSPELSGPTLFLQGESREHDDTPFRHRDWIIYGIDQINKCQLVKTVINDLKIEYVCVDTSAFFRVINSPRWVFNSATRSSCREVMGVYFSVTEFDTDEKLRFNFNFRIEDCSQRGKEIYSKDGPLNLRLFFEKIQTGPMTVEEAFYKERTLEL